jgi:hypothetical protein
MSALFSLSAILSGFNLPGGLHRRPRRLNVLILLFLLGGLLACGSNERGPEEEAGADTTELATTRELPPAGEAAPPCPVAGSMLEGNWFHASQEGLLLAIVADSTTFDQELGPSHRVLEIYDTESCAQVERHVLPVTRSPDFAYLIAEITYNNNSRIVGLKGFDVIYAYDVETRRLLPRMEPKYKNERIAVDAQSGMIHRLEVWENFLVGYAEDFGAFVFDLRDKADPKAVLPFAEYLTPSGRYASLFLLPSGNRLQALLPLNGQAPSDFAINPLFEKPQPLSTNVSKSALDNRFIVLRLQDEQRRAVAVDMLERKRVALPAELQTATTQNILEWLREEG